MDVNFGTTTAEVIPSAACRYTVNLVFFFVDKQLNDSGEI
jgi:hypothetical protein